MWVDFFPPFVMALREWLEAFLAFTIMYKLLRTIGTIDQQRALWIGVFGAIVFSFAWSFILTTITTTLHTSSEPFAKLWEAWASFVALCLVTSYIIWMLKNESSFITTIKEQVTLNLSTIGIITLAFTLIAREAMEIVLFTFAWSYTYRPVLFWILISLLIVVVMHIMTLRVPLKPFFIVSMIYLILQAWFMFWYSIHELLSVARDLWYATHDGWYLIKAFDLTGTILDHKTGLFGLPMYVLLGWYSKPECIQFVVQYMYVITLWFIWYRYRKSWLL